jgi:hypothetical protein
VTDKGIGLEVKRKGDNVQHAVKEALIDSSFFSLSSFGRVLIKELSSRLAPGPLYS